LAFVEILIRFLQVLKPVFKNDLFVVSFGLPALSNTPRVLDTAPTVRSDASNWTYQGTRDAVAKKNMMNVASYNYLGFVDLEHNTRQLLEYTIRELPLANDQNGCNAKLEEEMKIELRKFMDFEGCVLTSTGYAINLVAFPAMAASSKDVGDERLPIFLMDSESHSSMFMGAFIACAEGRGNLIKFRHNDLVDLEEKLLSLMKKLPRRKSFADKSSLENVWVTIEGLYSMNGTVSPLPEIVALKRRYGFKIYIDEAHSFLAIGHAGRGIVEYFQDRDVTGDNRVSMNDIDMIGGTLSKSLSSVGGFVITHNQHVKHIEARSKAMRNSGESSIPTLSIIRTLEILKKPVLVSRRLANLRSISAYMVAALEQKGYNVLFTNGGPLIAIVVDTIDRVLNFLKVGRQLGLICCGAAYPAAPRGAPRVRLSLTGAHTLDDADEILQLIDQISIDIGLKGLRLSKAEPVDKLLKGALLQSTGSTPLDENDPAEISDAVDASILALCPPSLHPQDEESKVIRSAGINALSMYNLGAAGPRWMCGTFSAHMSLEDLINTKIMSIITSSISSKDIVSIKSSLFTDSRVGIMSIIATVMEGLTPRRTKSGEKHLVLLPQSAGIEIREGAAAAQKSKSVETCWYTSDDKQSNNIEDIFAQQATSRNKLHTTLYIDSSLITSNSNSNDSNLASGLHSLLAPFCAIVSSTKVKRPLSTTIIVNDTDIFNSRFSSTQSIISCLYSLFPDIFNSHISSTRFLLFGSFLSLPQLPGIQGAFCTGSQHLVEKVQFLGQGVSSHFI
jgi:serine palmitoyltransferase